LRDVAEKLIQRFPLDHASSNADVAGCDPGATVGALDTASQGIPEKPISDKRTGEHTASAEHLGFCVRGVWWLPPCKQELIVRENPKKQKSQIISEASLT
jgi:hypothetical protein